jgi:hypothetical protein
MANLPDLTDRIKNVLASPEKIATYGNELSRIVEDKIEIKADVDKLTGTIGDILQCAVKGHPYYAKENNTVWGRFTGKSDIAVLEGRIANRKIRTLASRLQKETTEVEELYRTINARMEVVREQRSNLQVLITESREVLNNALRDMEPFTHEAHIKDIEGIEDIEDIEKVSSIDRMKKRLDNMSLSVAVLQTQFAQLSLVRTFVLDVLDCAHKVADVSIPMFLLVANGDADKKSFTYLKKAVKSQESIIHSIVKHKKAW